MLQSHFKKSIAYRKHYAYYIMVILCQGEIKEVGGKSLSLSLCIS